MVTAVNLVGNLNRRIPGPSLHIGNTAEWWRGGGAGKKRRLC